MLKVKDIMSKDVQTLAPDTSVEEAAKILSETGISGLPVVKDGKLVGIVSESDLIVKDKKLHFPDYINVIGGIIYLESYKKFREEFKKFIAVEVKDLMTEKVITISPEATVEDAATLMSDKDVNRLPVVEGDKLVGIVTRGDIVKDLARGEE
ncbi:MAG TPA: CBS domain-containing protein [Halanaerobiales bacterium]|nr:CBS domain-containing protein [Halanaerobiales bacterium]